MKHPFNNNTVINISKELNSINNNVNSDSNDNSSASSSSSSSNASSNKHIHTNNSTADIETLQTELKLHKKIYDTYFKPIVTTTDINNNNINNHNSNNDTTNNSNNNINNNTNNIKTTTNKIEIGLCIELVGNRFLRQMVRRLVATVVRETIGYNRSSDDIRSNKNILVDICHTGNRYVYRLQV